MLTPEATIKLEAFFSRFAPGAKPVLLLDYDGTLAPFHVDRFQARPWPGARELLAKIQRQGRTRMVVVTGRPAEEIRPLLGLEPPLETWGLHGVERLFPDGRRELEQLPPGTVAKLNRLRERLRRDSFGGLFEDKPNAVVMHWRGVAPEKAQAIEREALALFEPLAQSDGLRLLKFESGLELRAGRDKGGAVAEILKETAAAHPTLAAYLGDDATDEEAFRALNRSGGAHLSVLVRPEERPTEADVWLRPPEELLEFLRMWLDSLGNGPSAAQ